MQSNSMEKTPTFVHIYMQKKGPRHILHILHQDYLKMGHRLEWICKTVKHLGKTYAKIFVSFS